MPGEKGSRAAQTPERATTRHRHSYKQPQPALACLSIFPPCTSAPAPAPREAQHPPLLVGTSPTFPCRRVGGGGQGLRALRVSLERVLSPLAVLPVHASWGVGVLQESGSAPPPLTNAPASQPLGSWGLFGAWEGKRNCPPHPAPGQGEGRGWGETKGPLPPLGDPIRLRFPVQPAATPSAPRALSISPSIFSPVILCPVTVTLQ